MRTYNVLTTQEKEVEVPRDKQSCNSHALPHVTESSLLLVNEQQRKWRENQMTRIFYSYDRQDV